MRPEVCSHLTPPHIGGADNPPPPPSCSYPPPSPPAQAALGNKRLKETSSNCKQWYGYSTLIHKRLRPTFLATPHSHGPKARLNNQVRETGSTNRQTYPTLMPSPGSLYIQKLGALRWSCAPALCKGRHNLAI